MRDKGPRLRVSGALRSAPLTRKREEVTPPRE